ncbi:hypothetical protein Micbo1qcDRAFT_159655 [Microdochium bolleyi]|uniref:Uncharacterized protein n=1 Tax=Microdochium bolleyi TaxID=196109 RepID=A0A136JBG1_9PEZI|nr:hypothetical protein Micbo1qcDRAFT_159655 [Microdochium bolleyi]
MTGRSVQGRKSKEPDITVAMFKCGREQSVTIYEPNLQRVEVEDRKGLEVVLLLGAEVIREIYLFPNRDSFNITGKAPAVVSKRKNSRPISPAQAVPVASPGASGGYAMSGAVVSDVPPKTGSPLAHPPAMSSNNVSTRPDPQVEAETKRLQAMVEQEKKEREKKDREEQKRIKKLLEEEEKERKRRDAEVAKETERLKKLYGTEGQDYGPKPALPPRPNGASNRPPQGHGGAGPSEPSRLNVAWNNVTAPPRPLSAGPPPKASGSGFSRFFHSSGDGYAPQQQQQQSQPPKSSRRRKSDEGSKLKKKKSGLF